MTDILVNWLNNELTVSSPVDQKSFTKHFASGFLIGEVLSKYQLQDDFDQFSQSRTADSKLNNFMRIEPVLHLLGIPFDTNVARDIMTERHGVATRVMYQLYVALNNKKKAQLTGVAMETMRPAAPAKLNLVETEIYKQRLKHATPRQTDLNLEALVGRFHEKQIEMERVAFKKRFIEQERILEEQKQQRLSLLERSRELKIKQSEMVAKIQAATVQIPKPPPNQSGKAIQMRRDKRRRKDALEAITAIAHFEEKMKSVLPPTKLDDDTSESIDTAYLITREDDKLQIDPIELIKPTSNDDYIGKIRKRLNEDSTAREEREKRRRKVLVDQMNAHEYQEEARREEMMVNRLMRQSQQERRIAVQLLQARHEKEVIRRNRINREQQYEERRLRDFEDALDKEAYDSYVAGVFWIDYESLCQFYDVFYINWNPDLFTHTTCMHYTWKAKEGPKKDSYNISDNPQYRLEIKSPSAAAVWILLTRHITDKDDFADNREFITVLVYKTGGKRVFYPYDPPPFKDGVRINSPHYLCKLVQEKGTSLYTLVISQYEKSNTIHYTLRVFSTCEFSLKQYIDPYKPQYQKKLTGQWKGRTAGGCANNQDTHNLNPIYQLLLDNTSCDNHILIELLGPKQYSVGFEVIAVSQNTQNAPGSFTKKTSGDFRPGYSVLQLEAISGGVYNIMPCTFRQGKEGPFFLEISSSAPYKISQLQ